MKKWYEKGGQETGAVIGTRARLTRNLGDYPFPVKMTVEQQGKVEQTVHDTVIRGNSSVSNDFWFISLDDINQNEAVSLVGHHLISPELISTPNGRGLLLTQDETVSVMINEEDHLQIQVMCESLDLEGACEMIDRVDALLNESLHFAFDEDLGYLTQYPIDLGTGMRVSLMLHLPALQESDVMYRVAPSLSKLGLVIRGIYGKGSELVGAIYQLSNRVTLGLSKQSVIANLKGITSQPVTQERAVQVELMKTVETQDQIFHSIGILKNARVFSSDEFMWLISCMRMGVATELLTGIPYDTINSLVVQIQPATMMLTKKVATAERDVLHANTVSQRLNIT